jgi:hypothetical protein
MLSREFLGFSVIGSWKRVNLLITELNEKYLHIPRFGDSIEYLLGIKMWAFLDSQWIEN